MSEKLHIEVCYAMPDEQVLRSLTLDIGATAHQAIEASGLPERFPEIDLARNKVGIFGKLIQLDTPLRDHDRVEIYRPLIADPKEVRRKRALAAKTTRATKAMKKGGGNSPP